jgi:hypothetical protein
MKLQQRKSRFFSSNNVVKGFMAIRQLKQAAMVQSRLKPTGKQVGFGSFKDTIFRVLSQSNALCWRIVLFQGVLSKWCFGRCVISVFKVTKLGGNAFGLSRTKQELCQMRKPTVGVLAFQKILFFVIPTQEESGLYW